ncbi:MAG: secretin and TonB N-terminal domain-containing protein, partial [Candidatus Omnitrophica bacterium]|nr:secretin and TonB N-terminal domain-containing protein [Candidatus Omnitrophota bacterium]
MKNYKVLNFCFLIFLVSSFIFYASSLAQDAQVSVSAVVGEAKKEEPATEPLPEVTLQVKVPAEQILSSSENVTLDFKEADIQNVLKIVSYKSGVNIVTTPDVMGNITVRLVDVPWETALDVILKTYGYSYQKQGNIILVTKMENIAKIQSEEPLQTEVFTLKFLDAQDAQKILIPLLSPRGRISVLYSRGQKGWKFGTFKIGKESATSSALAKEQADQMKSETISVENTPSGELRSRKAEFEPSIKSKIVLITDTASSLDRIRNVILPLIDKKPRQVLIETKILQVKKDKLRDLGVDWGTGSDGATATNPVDLKTGHHSSVAGRSIGGGKTFTPNAFSPLEGTTVFPGTEPYKAGAELIFKKLGGTSFEVILHALEEDAGTNTLSAPRILTLDNQEASILVGYHTPILTSTVTAGDTNSGPTQTQTLDYYQEIGIRLNVVPQISDEGYINMIIHPSVTSSTSSVTAKNIAGTGANAVTTETSYPIIDVREAQTQVLIKNKETIVIGGLLKDVKTKETIGIPFIMNLPWIGKFFSRETEDTQKVDLLIFI